MMGKVPTHLAKYAFKKGSGPVTAKQAKAIASTVSKKKMAPSMDDPEDMIDKGVDESTEKN